MFDEALGWIDGGLRGERNSSGGAAQGRVFPCQHVHLCLAGDRHPQELSVERSRAEEVAALCAGDLVGPQ